MQCHSLAVGYRKRCDEIAFHKMCNVTHSLLVIGKDLMRLPFTKCVMSFTRCHGKRCDETAFHKMYNVTHSLSVIGKDVMNLCSSCAMFLTYCWSYKNVMRLSFKNVQSHSLAVGHRKRCDETAFHNAQCHLLPAIGHRKRCAETAFHKMCNVTHKLLVMGKDVMRLPSYATHLLLVIGKDIDVMGLPFTCHSLAVGHKKR